MMKQLLALTLAGLFSALTLAQQIPQQATTVAQPLPPAVAGRVVSEPAAQAPVKVKKKSGAQSGKHAKGEAKSEAKKAQKGKKGKKSKKAVKAKKSGGAKAKTGGKKTKSH